MAPTLTSLGGRTNTSKSQHIPKGSTINNINNAEAPKDTKQPIYISFQSLILIIPKSDSHHAKETYFQITKSKSV